MKHYKRTALKVTLSMNKMAKDQKKRESEAQDEVDEDFIK